MAVTVDPVVVWNGAAGLAQLLVPLDQLHSLEGNPRRGDVAAVVRSYEQFGQRKPIVARHRDDGLQEVTAGNTQLAAAARMGWSHIAVVWADDDDVTAKAWALADNRTSDLGIYDEAALAAYLEAVKLAGNEALLAATSYSSTDILQLLARQKAGRTDPNAVPEQPEARFSEPGVLWQLGDHRLLCGDATRALDLERIMAGDQAQLVYTDPPYGVAYEGGTTARPTHQGDAGSAEQLVRLFEAPFVAAAAVGAHNCALVVWHAGAHAAALWAALDRHGWEARAQLVWVKNHAQFGALGAQYHQAHEPAMYCVRRGHAPKWNGPATETTCWHADRSARNDWHPTQKPVELAERALLNHTDAGDVVLDLFGGSGSTLIGAERTGRMARLVEIEPGYCDVICRRWQDYTGIKPLRDGEPVDFESAVGERAQHVHQRSESDEADFDEQHDPLGGVHAGGDTR